MNLVDSTADSHKPARASWVVSVVLHVAFMLVLGWVIQPSSGGITEEPARQVAVVLKHMTTDGEMYEGEADTQQTEKTLLNEVNDREIAAALADAPVELDPAEALPELPAIGPGSLPGSPVGDAGELTNGAQQPRTLTGGRARVNVYGVSGEGRKFVYVFDRSLSMSGRPLASAKAELLGSLTALDRTHQFQILFFNNNVHVFDFSGGQGRIPFASDRTKDLAARFVGGITADGGTDRYAALMRAVSMRPDVIFFLSDADDPMTPLELDRLRRKNKELSVIHAIEFGEGPFSGIENFLHSIARQNGGQWTYVDTSRL
ncbi:MAG: hypothetical protein KDA42_01485 [Planctomycetales bacterium]|nr:hypothetical protein [Planctomycetales bacterium]